MQKQSDSIFDHPFLGRGFRPFFFLGALYSMISLFLWAGFYAGHVIPPSFMMEAVSWHAHEMIYGFTMAIVAGFLLTAVANWTGGAPARQMHLAGLCLVWLSGRMVMNVDFNLSYMTVLIIESAFIPALAVSLAIPLLKSRNKRNFIFLALLTILFACNLWFFLSEERTPLYVAVMVIVTMISLIGGRIIPAFTVAALRRRGEEAHQIPQGKLDATALISLLAIMISLVFFETQSWLLFIVSITSVVIHVLRLRNYYTRRILNDPMVWILHVGYAWVVLGLVFMGLSALDMMPFSIALHALTAGAIGSMTLGMMCRVALGHTGRDLIAGKITTISFLCMQVAAILRIFGPVIMPEKISVWIITSAVFWSVCFLLYIMVYSAALWKSRPDGRVA